MLWRAPCRPKPVYPKQVYTRAAGSGYPLQVLRRLRAYAAFRALRFYPCPKIAVRRKGFGWVIFNAEEMEDFAEGMEESVLFLVFV
jgi:hypothetical protein